MKRIVLRTSILAAVAAALLFFASGEGTRPVVPFATTPVLDAFSASSGITLLVRQPDNQYARLRFGITAPYGMLSSIESLAGIISGSTTFSLNTPAGPAGVGLASQYVAIGDFKGDGSPGVAYVDVVRNRNKVTVYLGSPQFVYGGSAAYTVGPEAKGVSAADFDGDGKTDVAVVYAGSGAVPGGVAILLNRGDGTFEDAGSYAVGNSPVSMTVLDLNHDGLPDLAVADGAAYGSAGKVLVLRGTGGGTFAAGVSYAVGKNPLCVVAADFDGDANPDLAVTASDGTVAILRSNGGGTFRAGASYPTGREPRYAAAGDFNGDGKMDLAVASSLDQNVSVLLGQGDGSFQAGATYCTSYYPESVIVADYDGDGKLDILQGTGDARGIGPGVESRTIDILKGKGDGTFQGATSQTAPGGLLTGTFLATGDFNGDGKIDGMLNDKYGDKLYLFAGTGQGTFQAPVALGVLATGLSQVGPAGGAAGDFNGDGRLDLAVTEEFAGKVAVLAGSASGLQLVGTFDSGGAVPGRVVTADFNGDGKQDLAVLNGPSTDRTTAGNLAVLHGNGNGGFQLARTYPAGTYLTGLATADLNGDGKPDLVAADQSDPFAAPRADGALYVFLNAGNGGFAAPTKVSAATYPQWVRTADVNGDGKTDLVAGTRNSLGGYALMVLRGNGDATFQAAVTASAAYGPSDAVVEDFSGDGNADLVVSHCCGDTKMSYLQGNGDGTFAEEVPFNGGMNPFTVAASDLNGDGKPDLMIGGTLPLTLTPLLGNGSAQAAPQISAEGVCNAANYVCGKVSAGEIAAVYGLNFGPSALATLHYTNGIADTVLGGTRIYFDNVAAPMVYAVAGQPAALSCVVPYGVAGKTTVVVQVEHNGLKGNAVTVPVAEAVPGLFSMGQTGAGPGAILNWPDYSVNSAANRVPAGGFIMAYGTGEGATDIGIDGQRVPLLGPYPKPRLGPWTATVGGKAATVSYYGATPDSLAGLFQVNIQIPAELTAGVWDVVIRGGEFSSQAGLTVAVKANEAARSAPRRKGAGTR